MTNGPKAIGIIMDGNRRWARERGLPTFEGHKMGIEKITEVFSWAQEVGVAQVTIYAFSTENWKRAPEEVAYLMELFEKFFTENLSKLQEKGGRVRFMGDRSLASKKTQEILEEVEEKTALGTAGTLAVAFSYGGRPEILSAVNSLLKEGKSVVNEEEFESALWTAGLQDPDLILRTGGEQRLSNFLAWQSVYSELFFTATKWPAFSKEEFMNICSTYAERERRHGK
ncbi:di-trans,poly-cis-decaprenylcistransferase [Patescibacteria group bacterium]|nr:di-trans,poly-cis-decaprenylcistransferase [Patescibacteria group bacterium]MBU2080371.1 di-trans,poly-cis-decaprenylcistransferase [Patescibacteria group bacterium]MBU2124217.1 di-trans,poly-cis-decaprenylcistransferase [Patescibacteria group bacterium]MBU2194332.1 di-trans,poly-cis-decaprenylcistransferase [Patescibacteria group bacterium]MBU2329997.1 di-trans,poly-cis-decaprenylcistransferase [Patescibacteria group bacterium]